MLVVVEYISKIKIEGTEVPVYVTDDSRMFVGMEIMPYLNTPQKVKQAIITDKDAVQYTVYPTLEVFKHIKDKKLLLLDTSTICEKQQAIIPVEKQVLTPENEFALTLKKMLSPKKKK